MNTPTPETNWIRTYSGHVQREAAAMDLCERMKRERDEARADLSHCQMERDGYRDGMDKARELARWAFDRLLAIADDYCLDTTEEICMDHMENNPEIFNKD